MSGFAFAMAGSRYLAVRGVLHRLPGRLPLNTGIAGTSSRFGDIASDKAKATLAHLRPVPDSTAMLPVQGSSGHPFQDLGQPHPQNLAGLSRPAARELRLCNQAEVRDKFYFCGLRERLAKGAKTLVCRFRRSPLSRVVFHAPDTTGRCGRWHVAGLVKK